MFEDQSDINYLLTFLQKGVDVVEACPVLCTLKQEQEHEQEQEQEQEQLEIRGCRTATNLTAFRMSHL